MSETGLSVKTEEGRITAFLRWWGSELLALLPAWLTGPLGLSQEILLLSPHRNTFGAQRLRGGRLDTLGLLDQPEVVTQLARLRALGAECVLRLPAEQGLRRQAPIAVSALPRGFDAVAGEIERQTPFAPDQVYLGYRVDEAVDPRGRVMAYLTLAPCAGVDAHLQKLDTIALRPDRVTLADDTGVNPVGDTVHILYALRRAPLAVPLLLAAAISLLLALASPHLRNASVLSDVQQQLAAAKQNAALLADNQRGQSDAQSQLTYLAGLRAQRPPITTLLDALSRALPDTAHLAQFELASQSVSLQGVAQSASDLVAPLEALPMVKQVKFSAPTLRDPAAGLEQFQMTLTLQAGHATAVEQDQ